MSSLATLVTTEACGREGGASRSSSGRAVAPDGTGTAADETSGCGSPAGCSPGVADAFTPGVSPGSSEAKMAIGFIMFFSFPSIHLRPGISHAVRQGVLLFNTNQRKRNDSGTQCGFAGRIASGQGRSCRRATTSGRSGLAGKITGAADECLRKVRAGWRGGGGHKKTGTSEGGHPMIWRGSFRIGRGRRAEEVRFSVQAAKRCQRDVFAAEAAG